MLLPPLKSWPRSLLCAVAMTGALLLHLLIFALLSLRPATVKTGGKHAEPACTTFRADGEHAEWEQQLSAFCDIHDPSLLSEANARHGFSSCLSHPKGAPLSNTSLPPPKPATQPPSSFPASSVAGALPPVTESIGQHWPAAVRNPQGKIPSKSLPSGIVWRFADGTLLTPPPDIQPDAAEKAAADAPPASPSRFEVRLPLAAFQSRLRLTDSCGNPKLDRLALSALSTRLRQWDQARLARKPDAESARFTAGNDFTQVVEIEWRLRSDSP